MLQERASRVAVGSLLAGLLSISLAPLARAGEEEIRRDVKVLASDEYEGRATATKGGALAADYVERRMQEAGLMTRRQRFPFQAGVKVGEKTTLVLSHVDAAGKELWASGDSEGSSSFRPVGFSANGSVKGPVVFCGFGIAAPEAGFDELAGVDVKGKVVLLLDRTPAFEKASPLAKDGALRYGQLRYKVMLAKEKGALAVLVTSSSRPDAGGDPSLLPLSGGAFQGDVGIPVADIARSRAARLAEAAGTTLELLQSEIERSGKPASRELPGVSAALSVDLVRERREAENVIGVRPGTDPALSKETIVVGAHMDHLGYGEVGGSLAESAVGKEIHNGADDNASGTAALLDLARRLPKTRRTLVFIAFSGEEMGLLGSAAYVKDAPIPLASTVAMLNMDMVGRLEKKKLTVGGMGTAEEWASLVPECAQRADIGIAPESDGYGPSDHSSFYGKGVPVLFLFTGAHADYHRPSDDWEKIDFAGTDRITRFASEVVTSIDALEKRPTHKAAAGNPHGGELEPSRGPSVYLGTIPDYSETERPGVRLTGVREGSPAAAAGLLSGDVIVEFDGHEVRSVQDYTYVLFAKKQGDKVSIVVERGDARARVSLTAIMGRKGGKVEMPKDGNHGTPTLPEGHPPVAPTPEKAKEPVLF